MSRPADNIVIAEYDPAWPRLFAAEREGLQQAIGEWAVAIEHVGSTAVPGLAAKPIIDIGVALEQLADALRCISPLHELGYECCGEFGIPDRIFFRKLTDSPLPGQITDGHGRTHQIHMYQRDHEQFRWHIAFRDYMRAYPEAAAEYAALKRNVAARHGDDIEKYVAGKHDYIRGILRDAGCAEAVA
ncbi:MAG TPA: GrpB family protein [Dehalococcoidia bacterium]|nr:GrpB family protein [Dehalococcoidia bacterium]